MCGEYRLVMGENNEAGSSEPAILSLPEWTSLNPVWYR